MEERIIERDDCYEIMLVEFIAPNGRVITSFFKVTRTPHTCIGAYDTLEEARSALHESFKYNLIPTLH